MEKELIARWESKFGRYWMDLYRSQDGSFSYRGDNSGGVLPAQGSVVAALDHMRTHVLPPSFPSDYVRVR